MIFQILPDGAKRLRTSEVSDERNDQVVQLHLAYDTVVCCCAEKTAINTLQVGGGHQVHVRGRSATAEAATANLIINVRPRLHKNSVDVFDVGNILVRQRELVLLQQNTFDVVQILGK